MASHYELVPDPQSLPLSLSQEALRLARTMQTANAGSIWVPNGDGTGTLIGEQAGTDETGKPNGSLKFVGDTTAPSAPTGVTADCVTGCILMTWDGTLAQGMPADFRYVAFYIQRKGEPVVELGWLTTKGSISSGLLAEDDWECWAVAVDVQANRSPESGHITVHVSDPLAEAQRQMDEAAKKADQASQKAQEAVDAAEQTRKDAASAVQQVRDDAAQAKQDAADAKKKADDAAAKADETAGRADTMASRITNVEKTVTDQGVKLSGAVKNADAALTASSETKQTLTELSSTVESHYTEQQATDAKADKAANDAATSLDRVSKVEQTAASITSTVESHYKEQQAAAAKADKAANDAAASLDRVSKVEQTAASITSRVTEVSRTADSALTTATTAKQTADGLTAKVAQAYTTASSALDRATTVETNLDGFKTTVSTTYATNEKVDSMRLGGVNLARLGQLVHWNETSFTYDRDTDTYTITSPAGTNAFGYGLQVRKDDAYRMLVPYGKPMLFSLDVYSPVAGRIQFDTNCYPVSGSAWSGNDNDNTAKRVYTQLVKANTWTQVTALYWNTDSHNTVHVDLYDCSTIGFDTRERTEPVTWKIRRFKAELGTKPTEWSSNQADLDAVYATKSELTQTDSRISAKVSENAKSAKAAMDKATTVEQTANGLKATVSEQAKTLSGHTTTIGQLQVKADSFTTQLTQTNQKIDGLELGGTNLLRDTKAFYRTNVSASETGYLTGFSATLGESYRGFTSRRVTASGGGVLGEWQVNDCQPGDEYVFSFWAKGTGKLRAYFYGPSGYIPCEGGSSSTGETVGGMDGQTNLTLASTWKRYWIRWKLRTSGGSSNTKLALLRNDNKGDWQACGAKLEKGNKVSDWSPSPLDAQSTADAAVTRTTSLEQNLNGFKTTVGQTYETKSDSLKKQTTLQQNLDSFKTTVSQTYETKSDSLKKQTTLQQNLDGFKSTVSATYSTKTEMNGVKSTAEHANTLASDALSKAVKLIPDPTMRNNPSPYGGMAQNQTSGAPAAPPTGYSTYAKLTARDNGLNQLINVTRDCTYLIEAWVCSAPGETFYLNFGFTAYDKDNKPSWPIVSGSAPTTTWKKVSVRVSVSGLNVRTMKPFIQISNSGTTPIKGWYVTGWQITDITDVRNLETSVASTYTTKTEFTQTTSSITATVSKKLDSATAASTYARATEVKQTTDSLSVRITTAQNTANSANTAAGKAQSTADAKVSKGTSGIASLETALTMDANGVTVSKKVNGVAQGYQTRLTNNGLDILDQAGAQVASYQGNDVHLGKKSDVSMLYLAGDKLTIGTGANGVNKGFTIENKTVGCHVISGVDGTSVQSPAGDEYSNGKGGLALKWKNGLGLFGSLDGSMSIGGYLIPLLAARNTATGVYKGMPRLLYGSVEGKFNAKTSMDAVTVSGLPFTSWDSYIVLLQIMNNNSGTTLDFMQLHVIPSDFTPTSFKIRGWSDAATTRNYRVGWFAFGR
ncbi:hypothetical protein [Bifidobacterium olomucense]|uniref:Uncharacterized protein n=1 Tax=Bifidobacterium olomucense TaxID=2675324 RepID=A0A7Y0HXL9_9BIFI|nr:hypothetical protein [Bifidobacterium sp. DSM 109959]NMM98164.1 hypothetical protein [Bifidobacterium sp. DSM 109959]